MLQQFDERSRDIIVNVGGRLPGDDQAPRYRSPGCRPFNAPRGSAGSSPARGYLAGRGQGRPAEITASNSGKLTPNFAAENAKDCASSPARPATASTSQRLAALISIPEPATIT